MVVDAHLAGEIDRCQCLPHTGQVTTSPDLQERPLLPVAEARCTPLLREPITASQAADLARLLKALADPTRLRLGSMVAAHEVGEACVCRLTDPLALPQPTLSHPLTFPVDRRSSTRTDLGVRHTYAPVPSHP